MLVSIISTIVIITVISSITKCYYGHNGLCSLVILLVLLPHHTLMHNINLSDIYLKVVSGVIKYVHWLFNLHMQKARSDHPSIHFCPPPPPIFS